MPISQGHRTGWSIFLGILLIVVGVLAIMAPFFAGVAASIFFGWLLMVGAIAHLIYAWSEHGAGAILWQVVIGLVYMLAALYLFLVPVSGMLALTLIFAVFIGIEGVVEVALFLRLRSTPGAGFFLLDGIVSLLLAGLIFFHWPWSSGWMLGTLVGISLIFSGVARLSPPIRRRRVILLAM